MSVLIPEPCDSGGGTGDAGNDVESLLLCDVLPDGSIAGTALAVYEYDPEGNPIGAPTFVNPATGTPYVAQGILGPCPGDVGCAAPVPFCFTTTTTGPVDHPGRTYDLSLPINPGFAVDSLQIDATSFPANVTWAVTDADGEQFRTNLQAFLAARFPEQTVTVTNPNAGTPVCGLAQPMQIHIECARIDDGAPNLVELIYNGGRDLVVNPAYLTTPPTNLNGPQFVYLQRQDAGGTLNCTNVANQGWETNDLGPNATRDFELWGQGPGGLQTIQDTTPTPRGTPVQEITADINDTGANPTIWQTFTVPAAGTVRVVMVHGARDTGETHRITLSTGDDNDNQTGDIINNVTNPPQVTNAGGGEPGPWTTFQQDVALGAGTYTFALSTTNPVGANRGGLFTDMRVIVDSPDQHAAAVTDDDTCVVTTNETVTTTTCEYWQPRCSNGEITAWVNVADGQELTNAQFWGQVPAPSCCTPEGGSGGGGSVAAGNLTNNYTVCGVVGGIPQTLERVVITDQSGGLLAQTFVGADGGPVTPTSYTVGSCGDPNRDVEIIELCDVLTGGAIVPFIRVEVYNSQTGAFILSRNEDGNGGVYSPTGTVTTCSAIDNEQEILCDDNGPFIRVYTRSGGLPSAVNDLLLDGVTPYVTVGTVGNCVGRDDTEVVLLCDDTGVPFLRAIRYDGATVAGVTNWELDGTTPFVPVEPAGVCPPADAVVSQDVETFILCDANGTRFMRAITYNGIDGSTVIVRNTTLDGTTNFAPVGAVGVCATTVATDLDFFVLELCDDNGAFLRRLTFNSQTGAVTATTNTTLAGAAYVPVGTVGICDGCCPVVVGEGCYNAGSGRYTAIRQPNGTITLIDSVSGAAVLAANIVPCASDDTAVTLTSQARLLAAGESWTPGADVVGTLTGVSFTVISGTATLTDENGTVSAGLPPGLTGEWQAEDNNTLVGPDSIDAIGGNTWVTWTVR